MNNLTIEERSYHLERVHAITSDNAFKRAMLDARARGEIEFKVGVAQPSNDAFIPTHFEREPTMPLMGSCAELCVESADRQELPDGMIPSMGGTMR